MNSVSPSFSEPTAFLKRLGHELAALSFSHSLDESATEMATSRSPGPPPVWDTARLAASVHSTRTRSLRLKRVWFST